MLCLHDTSTYILTMIQLQELGASRKYSEQQIEAQLLQDPPPDVGSDDDDCAVLSPELETLASAPKKRKRRHDNG